MQKEKSKEKIGVLLSGGVDSSVAAHTLLQAGREVCGIFITIWNPSHIPCTAKKDRQDAMRACAALGIPFLEYNATEVYHKKVIEPFVEAYRRGETPNPDVLCNQFVKFDAVFDFAQKKGFVRIATGHYAIVREADGVCRLYQSADKEKDQTYFIYTITQEVLNRTLFPIGGYTKQRVRSIAGDAGLPAAQKKDSVGLCFLGDVSMKEFLSEYINPKEGVVRHQTDGSVIGTHDGAWFYTLGQRHGFTVAKPEKGPYIVVGKDVTKNILFVRQEGDAISGRRQYALSDVVFRRLPKDGELLAARYRHRGKMCPASLSVRDNDAEIVFEEPQHIAAGQSVVVYEGRECLGGGVVSH